MALIGLEGSGVSPVMTQRRHQNGGTEGAARQGSSAWLFSSAVGPRIMLAADGVADIGGGDTKTATTTAATETATTTKAATETAAADKGATQTDKPARPDWLPESFWDAEKGFKKDDFDALVAAKAETDSRAAAVPATADKYEAKLPPTFKLPEGMELPEGETAVLVDEKDPRVAAAKDYALARKMTQPEFEELLAFGVKVDLQERADLNKRVGEEREKLGLRAKDRVAAVTTWLDAKIGADLGSALHPMMFTAKSVEAFERLMGLMRGDVPGRPGAGREGAKDPTKIDGYENMSFRQRMAAIEANGKTGT